MVDPDDGGAHSFVPTQTVNGVKCAKLEKADVEDEVQYWQIAVLCTVFGANPPFEIMKATLSAFGPTMTLIRSYMCAKEFSWLGLPRLRTNLP